jgi:hypothetical protein
MIDQSNSASSFSFAVIAGLDPVVPPGRTYFDAAMPGLDPGIHSATLPAIASATEWIAGSSPAMTTFQGRGRASGP